MSDPITSEISTRVCQHMNDDHSDAVLLYVKAYANQHDAQKATMVSIDGQGMNIVASINNIDQSIRIDFDHILQDAQDAHHTLIAMVKEARVKLNN